MPLTDTIVLNSLSSVRNIEDDFIRILEGTMRRLESNLTGILATSGTGAVDVALARQQIENVLLDSGYFQATGNLLNEGYQDAIEESFRIYQESIGENFQFAEVSLERLNSLKQLDLAQFGQLGDDFSNTMTRVLTDLQFGSITDKQAIDLLQGRVTQLDNFAQTWVTTGLSGVYRESSVMLASDNGLKEFIYKGPIDTITRPFCRQHVNEIKTVDEWNQLDNGQITPVIQFAGGFNCRHTLIGVK